MSNDPRPVRDPADLLRVPPCADAIIAGNEDDLRQLNEYLFGEAKYAQARTLRFASLKLHRDALAMRLHGQVVNVATTDHVPEPMCSHEQPTPEQPEPEQPEAAGVVRRKPGCPCGLFGPVYCTWRV